MHPKSLRGHEPDTGVPCALKHAHDLAESLAGAKNLADMAELQAAFWRKQFGALTAQAEEVRALSTKVTAAAAEPIKSQVARGADGRAH